MVSNKNKICAACGHKKGSHGHNGCYHPTNDGMNICDCKGFKEREK